ncbi:twin-arginine translocase subunit TatC [Paenibacillus harenae]|uniref:Sec-independent protein translocase protein TatC n=1 Tax=Paenibacillus harenae TaxID=306543 RepID=A0ABT9U862_PAEHA|nr:twin-arginine translocase subunit TatC [Paenibacillus harenae]MDQ0115845.1 sec-independent protein translocase protein TatC [Paenibacillus harenae]
MGNSVLMSFLEHLAQLRKQLIIIAVVFAACMALGLFAAPYIFDAIKSAPPASRMEWNTFSPFDGVRIYMIIAMVFALTLTVPVALALIWSFVKNGLYPHERAATIRYIPYSVICFVAGVCFGYFVVLPMSFSFVNKISENLNLTETYGVAEYFAFMLNIVLPIAAAFELPIIVMFLTRIGLLTPDRLKRSRRYAYLILVVVSNLMTPPDIVSDFLLLIPLIALFEISVWLSGTVYRKRMSAAPGAA